MIVRVTGVAVGDEARVQNLDGAGLTEAIESRPFRFSRAVHGIRSAARTQRMIAHAPWRPSLERRYLWGRGPALVITRLLTECRMPTRLCLAGLVTLVACTAQA